MLNIDKPRDSDIHTLCDFAELLCITAPDRVCSRETISDQIHDLGEAKVSDDALNDCFAQIIWRIGAYGEKYPFALDPHGRVLSAPEDLTAPQKLYMFLLVCANLPFIDAPTGDLTSAFERVAMLALRAVWPAGGTSRAFGKSETDYTGTKWQRLNQLASEIGGTGLCDVETFRRRDTGDGGIDLVAWLDLDAHEKKNIPSALAQCACSRDQWSGKQMEISPGRLKNSIHATHPWSQLMFIPQNFRDNRGKWAVPGEVADVILFDRLRIIKQLGDDIDWEHIDAPTLFNRVLDERRELV